MQHYVVGEGTHIKIPWLQVNLSHLFLMNGTKEVRPFMPLSTWYFCDDVRCCFKCHQVPQVG
jgi:hypothetical protein